MGKALILFFVRGRGRATVKPTGSRRCSLAGFAVRMEQTKWQRQKSRQSRNGHRTRITFNREMCYIWGNKLTDKIPIKICISTIFNFCHNIFLYSVIKMLRIYDLFLKLKIQNQNTNYSNIRCIFVCRFKEFRSFSI